MGARARPYHFIGERNRVQNPNHVARLDLRRRYSTTAIATSLKPSGRHSHATLMQCIGEDVGHGRHPKGPGTQ